MSSFPSSLRSYREPFLAGFACIGAASVLLTLLRAVAKQTEWSTGDVIDSPLQSVTPKLSIKDQDSLPYSPTALPGARDVDTPHGSIRVNEWGPEEGRKVLFVHGISTPSVALAGVADGLVMHHGCRVMLFDLFGRGFSSTPDPTTSPQDAQLFTTQILLVLASSPISWTGLESFAMIGYSMGGGISANFTSYFPNLVDSLVLIAPAGLMRASRISASSRAIYGGLMPQALLHYLVRRRLGGSKQPEKAASPPPTSASVDATGAMAAELETEPSHPALAPDSTAPLFPDRPSISVADAVAWQLEHHAGFLPAFISSIQHAPIGGQHARWRLIGSRLAAQRAAPYDTAQAANGLKGGKVLLLLGSDDSVVVADETAEDARATLGDDGVDVRVLAGGHDLPISASKLCVDAILDFWVPR